MQDSSLIRATVYVGGHIDSGIERCFVKERRQGISNIPRRRLCNCFVAIRLNQTMARYRNVTIWAHVHVLSGENVLSVVPAVTPLSNAHCTSLTFVPRPVLGICWCHNVPSHSIAMHPSIPRLPDSGDMAMINIYATVYLCKIPV